MAKKSPLRIWHYSPGGAGLEYGLDAVTPVDWQIGTRPPKRAQYVYLLPPDVASSPAFLDWLKANGPNVYGSKNEIARKLKEIAGVDRYAGGARNPSGRYHTRGNPRHPKRATTPRKIEGYYVMGRNQSVAWFKTREAAEAEAKRMNYRGGTHYTVEPSYARNPARPGKRAKSAARKLVRRYGKPRARKVAGGMIGRARTPRQREHFVKVRKAINPRRNPIPMFPIYIRRSRRNEWNLAAVGRTKELANLVARGLAQTGYYVAVTDGERPRQ